MDRLDHLDCLDHLDRLDHSTACETWTVWTTWTAYSIWITLTLEIFRVLQITFNFHLITFHFSFQTFSLMTLEFQVKPLFFSFLFINLSLYVLRHLLFIFSCCTFFLFYSTYQHNFHFFSIFYLRHCVFPSISRNESHRDFILPLDSVEPRPNSIIQQGSPSPLSSFPPSVLYG